MDEEFYDGLDLNDWEDTLSKLPPREIRSLLLLTYNECVDRGWDIYIKIYGMEN